MIQFPVFGPSTSVTRKSCCQKRFISLLLQLIDVLIYFTYCYFKPLKLFGANYQVRRQPFVYQSLTSYTQQLVTCNRRSKSSQRRILSTNSTFWSSQSADLITYIVGETCIAAISFGERTTQLTKVNFCTFRQFRYIINFSWKRLAIHRVYRGNRTCRERTFLRNSTFRAKEVATSPSIFMRFTHFFFFQTTRNTLYDLVLSSILFFFCFMKFTMSMNNRVRYGAFACLFWQGTLRV